LVQHIYIYIYIYIYILYNYMYLTVDASRAVSSSVSEVVTKEKSK